MSAVLDNGFAAFLAGLAARSLVILAAAGLAALAARRFSSAARHLIWSAAAAALIVMPILALALPKWSPEIAWPRAVETMLAKAASPASRHAGPAPAASPAGPTRTFAVPPGAPLIVTPESVGRPSTSGFRNGSAAAAPARPGITPEPAGGTATPKLATPDAAAPARRSVDLGTAAGIAWLAGFAGVLLLILAELIRLRAMQRSARPVTDGRADLCRHIARRMGIGRPIDTLEGDISIMPMTWGFRRPVVLLPAASRHWTTERLAAVLGHELAHVRRGDYAVQFLAECVTALYWFNPLAWYAAHRLKVERELACDDEVIAAGADAPDYAGELLELARSMRTVHMTSRAALSMARSTKLSDRLTAILDRSRARRGLARRNARAIVATALLLSAGLATTSPAMVAKRPRVVEIPGDRLLAPVTGEERAALRALLASNRALRAIVGPGGGRAVVVLPDGVDLPDIADLPDMIDMPDLPDMVDMPDLPDMVDMPDLPDMVDMPDLPDMVDMPDVPSLAPLATMAPALAAVLGSGPYATPLPSPAPLPPLPPTPHVTLPPIAMTPLPSLPPFPPGDDILGGFAWDDPDTDGRWRAERNGDWIQFEIRFRNGKSHWTTSNGHDIDEFMKMVTPTADGFDMRHDAGTFHCAGSFDPMADDDHGSGKVTFEPNPNYVTEMKKRGITVDRDELFTLAIQDVSYAFVDAIRKAGYTDVSLDRLVEFRIHGVTVDYIEQMHDAGVEDISAARLVEMRIHGVTPGFVRDMRKMGLKSYDPDDFIQMKIHGVTPEYAVEMGALGLRDLTLDDLLQMKIHGVTPDLIREFRRAGLDDIPADELIQLRIHGVTPDMAASLMEMGYERITLDELVQMKIQGVTPEFIRQLDRLGYHRVSIDDLVQMKIHGVTPEFIRELQRDGYDDLTVDELIQIRITNRYPRRHR